MELPHLRFFIGVAEEENVSRAALKLHVLRPAFNVSNGKSFLAQMVQQVIADYRAAKRKRR